MDEGGAEHTVVVQTASEFALDACRSRLLLLSPPDMPAGLSVQQRYSFLSRDLDFDATQMIRAAGALVSFLHKHCDALHGDALVISAIDNHALCETALVACRVTPPPATAASTST